jgi:hypothetical protein
VKRYDEGLAQFEKGEYEPAAVKLGSALATLREIEVGSVQRKST